MAWGTKKKKPAKAKQRVKTAQPREKTAPVTPDDSVGPEDTDETIGVEFDEWDEDTPWAPVLDFEKAVERRKKRIAQLQEGEKGDRRLAALISNCRKGNRCGIRECPVCERRKEIAGQAIPASVVKSYGSVDSIRQIRIAAIKVVGKRRPLNEKKVQALAASMHEIGLQTPISVHERKKDVILVTGLHRLEAAKRLSWDAIPCVALPADEILSPIWEIAENYYRAELPALDRAEATEKLRTLVQIKREAGQVARPGGHQPKDLGINETARALGLTREEVRRAKAIAGISSKAKMKVRELGLDDNQRALLDIASKPTEDQARAVDEIVQRKHAELAQQAAAPVADRKTTAEINTLETEIRGNESALAAARKRLQLIQDKLAVQGETLVVDEQKTGIPSLGPADEASAAALIEALNKYPKLKAKLAQAAPAVLDRVMATIRADVDQHSVVPDNDRTNDGTDDDGGRKGGRGKNKRKQEEVDTEVPRDDELTVLSDSIYEI